MKIHPHLLEATTLPPPGDITGAKLHSRVLDVKDRFRAFWPHLCTAFCELEGVPVTRKNYIVECSRSAKKHDLWDKEFVQRFHVRLHDAFQIALHRWSELPE